jgi:hypothetical protein
MPYLGNPAQQRFSSPRAASVYSGDGSTVAFTLEEVVSTDEDILVSVDGVIQEPSVAYAVSSGTTLTFTAAPSNNAGNNIFVYYIARTFGSVSMPDGQNVNASTLNTSGNVVFNEASADVDFRVESDNLTHALFVNGADGKIGIGESAPSEMLHIKDDTNDDAFGGLIIKSNNGTANVKYGWRGADGSDQLRLATGGNLALNIDSAGAVTMPLQPAFLVRPASEQSNIAVSSAVTIVFGTEVFDQNADFASNTFTAPVTGRYQLSANIRLNNTDSASDYYRIELNTSNRTYYQIFDPNFGQDAAFWTSTISVLVDMDASDTAIVKITQGGGTQQTDIDANNGYTTFSGYLVA